MFKHSNIYRVAFFIFLFSLSALAHAVVISSTKSRYEPAGIRFYFTVSDWMNGGGTFCENLDAPLCTIYIFGAQSPGNSSWMTGGGGFWEVKPSPTMEGVLAQMQGFSIPYHGSLLVPKGDRISDTFCITFADGYRWPNSGGSIVPKGPCARVVMPALQCEINGDTTINHHEIFSDAIDGNEAETQLQLTCTGASSVIAKTSVEDPLGIKLRANEGLYSKLTINGRKASEGVSIEVEEGLATNITLKSTLATKGVVKPGEFSGSTVLTISPP